MGDVPESLIVRLMDPSPGSLMGRPDSCVVVIENIDAKPPPSPAYVDMSMRLNIDIYEVIGSDAQRMLFESQFINDTATILDIPHGHLEILSIYPGSIVVRFRIWQKREGKRLPLLLTEVAKKLRLLLLDKDSTLYNGIITQYTDSFYTPRSFYEPIPPIPPPPPPNYVIAGGLSPLTLLTIVLSVVLASATIVCSTKYILKFRARNKISPYELRLQKKLEEAASKIEAKTGIKAKGKETKDGVEPGNAEGEISDAKFIVDEERKEEDILEIEDEEIEFEERMLQLEDGVELQNSSSDGHAQVQEQRKRSLRQICGGFFCQCFRDSERIGTKDDFSNIYQEDNPTKDALGE